VAFHRGVEQWATRRVDAAIVRELPLAAARSAPADAVDVLGPCGRRSTARDQERRVLLDAVVRGSSRPMLFRPHRHRRRWLHERR
jgi:hypothetical protein